jgi:hypothetical protein
MSLGTCSEEDTRYVHCTWVWIVSEGSRLLYLLLQIFRKRDFLANPNKVQNVDKCGPQMNNETGGVVATKVVGMFIV